MKFQQSTLVLLLIAVLLSGVVFVSEFLGKPQQEAQRAQQQQIFTFKEADVTSVRILTDAKAIEVIRKPAKAATPSPAPAAEAAPDSPAATEPSPKSSESPRWQLLQPVNTPGNDATVAYLLSLLTTSQYDRALTVPINQLAELGLDPPVARVEVTLGTGNVQRLVVGKPDFSNRFLYARVNPSSQPVSQVEVLLIPIDLESAIDRPLDDWKQASEPSPTSSGETTTAPTSPAPAIASPSPAPTPQQAADPKPSDPAQANP